MADGNPNSLCAPGILTVASAHSPSHSDPVGLTRSNAVVDCGWGRLIFGHTFRDPAELVEVLLAEQPGQRDVAFYIAQPQVVLALAPSSLFLDPSHTLRLNLKSFDHNAGAPEGFKVRPLSTVGDIDQVNRIYRAYGMVQIDPAFTWPRRDDCVLNYLVAEEVQSGAVLGAVTGVDHRRSFSDPENGSSLWSLAVDPQAPHRGVGDGLVRALAAHFHSLGRDFMDLSVMHDNAQAIDLYEKLGFVRLPTFTIKTKNSFNERLFVGPTPDAKLNSYAQIITSEARRRGIAVEVVDEPSSMFRLSCGGRSFVCRESLTSATSAAAMTICDDKALTRRILAGAGLRVPNQCVATSEAVFTAFLEEHRAVVVKPARGEQGRGIAVNLTTAEDVRAAVADARHHCDTVLLEEYVAGHDLRIVVIDFKVVAAAIRRPAQVMGTGRHSIQDLIAKQSQRRAAATNGESRIPLDAETQRCVQLGGYAMESILPAGTKLLVRRTANLHTGGTIHDVTDEIHQDLAAAAAQAARAIDIPIVGLDLIVPDIRQRDHWFIEANERPGLANHEPQPTAERLIDMLFPQSIQIGRIRRH